MVQSSGFPRCTAKLKWSKGNGVFIYETDTATFTYNMIGSEWTPMQRKNALTLFGYSVPRRVKLVIVSFGP